MKEIFNIRLAGRVKLILICSGEIYRLLKYYFFGSFIVYTFPTILITIIIVIFIYSIKHHNNKYKNNILINDFTTPKVEERERFKIIDTI